MALQDAQQMRWQLVSASTARLNPTWSLACDWRFARWGRAFWVFAQSHLLKVWDLLKIRGDSIRVNKSKKSMFSDMNRPGPFTVNDCKKQRMHWSQRAMQLPQSTVTLVPWVISLRFKLSAQSELWVADSSGPHGRNIVIRFDLSAIGAFKVLQRIRVLHVF